MKLNLSAYVPYGPVGHPDAAPLTMFMGQDKDDIEGQVYGWLSKISAQNLVPTVFFDDRKSLAENGYFVLKVIGDEISDDEIAALPRPTMFTPVAEGMPGRKLEQFADHIPSFYQHFNYEVWQEGDADCDHDFGLESYLGVFKEEATDRIMSESQGMTTDEEGSFYVRVTCSRCGAVHALKEGG